MTITRQDAEKLAVAFAKASGHPDPKAHAAQVAQHFGTDKAAKPASVAPAPKAKAKKKAASKH